MSAGCPEKPFKVHLPDSWEPEFYVEDFGIGLSPEDIEQIYTSYFTSTKTESNELIGGLGLGSKTPFAYTDTFTVRSRKDGIECTYNAYICETGEPTISLMAKHETEEPNGVKVSLPVNSNDFWQFQSDAQKIYSWFRVKPELNFDITPTVSESVVEVVDTKGYYIHSAQAWDNDFVVAVMGNVAYRVNGVTRQFGEQLDKGEKAFLGNNGIYVKFSIGDLDVAASRETISFDPETTKVFLERIKDCVTDFTSSTQNKIDQCETFIDTFPLIKEDIGMWALGAFEFNGVPIDELSIQDMFERIIEAEEYAGVDQIRDRIAKKDSKGYRNSIRYFKLTDYWGSSGQFKQFMQGLKGFVFVENCEKSTTTILRRCAEDYEGRYVVTMDGPIDSRLKSALKEEFGKHAKFLDGLEVHEIIKEERREARELAKQRSSTPGLASSPQVAAPRVTKEEIRIKEIHYANGTSTGAEIIDPATLPARCLIGYTSRDTFFIGERGISSYVSHDEFVLMCNVMNVDAIVVCEKRSYERNLRVLDGKHLKLEDVEDRRTWNKQYLAAAFISRIPLPRILSTLQEKFDTFFETVDPTLFQTTKMLDELTMNGRLSSSDMNSFIAPYEDRRFYEKLEEMYDLRVAEVTREFYRRYPLLNILNPYRDQYKNEVLEYIDLIDQKYGEVGDETFSTDNAVQTNEDSVVYTAVA